MATFDRYAIEDGSSMFCSCFSWASNIYSTSLLPLLIFILLSIAVKILVIRTGLLSAGINVDEICLTISHSTWFQCASKQNYFDEIKDINRYYICCTINRYSISSNKLQRPEMMINSKRLMGSDVSIAQFHLHGYPTVPSCP